MNWDERKFWSYSFDPQQTYCTKIPLQIFFIVLGAKDGKIKTEYKQDMVTLTADMDLNLAGPTINASAVAGHQGWLAGKYCFSKKEIILIIGILFLKLFWPTV